MSKRNLFQVVLLDLAIVVLTFLLFNEQGQLLLVYALGSIILLVIDRSDWKLFLVGAFTALICEPIAVRLGTWNYPDTTNIFDVPYWIFLMWGFAALSLFRVGTYITRKKV